MLTFRLRIFRAALDGATGESDRQRKMSNTGHTTEDGYQEAQNRINRAMSDPTVYAEMLKQESKTWSTRLPGRSTDEDQQEDQNAGFELGINRELARLKHVLARNGIAPERGLSLGCGEGRAERRLLKQRICKSWHGVDLAEEAIADARKLADGQNLPITYAVQDLNFVQLPRGEFDLVIAQTCLHHVLRLEHVIDEIASSLAPNGVLWVTDFIGETQLQFTDVRIKIVNELIDLLPEKHVTSALTGRTIGKLMRHRPATFLAPFESIRSGEIKKVLLSKFDVIEQHETASLINYVVPGGTRVSYLENADTRALFELLMYFDKLLIELSVLSPTSGQYLLRPKVS
jgi:SAM-dependent methyltransferase